jgi:hypothetical protein
MSSQDDLFLNGIYKQTIEVEYIKDEKQESHQFRALLKKSENEIYMYAYVSFGIKLFEVRDNFKEPIVFKANDDRIEKNRQFFLRVYGLIKEIITIRRSDERLQKNIFRINIQPENVPVDIAISSERLNGVPALIDIESSNRFHFKVTTDQFN